MRRLFLGLVYLMMAFGGTAAYGQRWYSDVDKGLEIAKEERKVLFVDFYADWCPHRQDMEDYVISRGPFRALAKSDLVLVRVDCSSGPSRYARSQMTRFECTGYPSFYLVDPNTRKIIDKLQNINERAFIYRVREAIDSLK